MPADRFTRLESSSLAAPGAHPTGPAATSFRAPDRQERRVPPRWFEAGGLLDALPYFIGCLALLTLLVRMLLDLGG